MQHEFDNTIDALLRRAANVSQREGEVLLESGGNHLEPDEIAAFAENVLPAAARSRYAGHLSECTNCRQTLSNLILINEAEEEGVLIPEEKALPAPRGWRGSWTRLFAFPNLGYAMAAMAILFFGVFSFVALRSTQQDSAPEVSQVATEEVEKAKTTKRATAPVSAPEPNPTVESTPEVLPEGALNFTDTATANTSGNSNQGEQTPNQGLPPSVRITRGEPNTETARKETEVVKDTSRNADVNPSNTATVAAAPPPPVPQSSKPAESKTVPAERDDEAGKTAALTATQAKPASEDRAGAQKLELPAQIEELDKRKAAALSKNRNSAATRNIGGKVFYREGAAWVDSAYGTGQKTTNVSRGSDDYKKLDAGLRSIADSFSGEVIIVWQGKAYKIR